jgi:hypothetical protein
MRRTRRKPDYDSAAWREGLGPCVITGAVIDIDAHHIIPAQVLRSLGLRAYLGDHRNRLAVRRDLHLNHHSGTRPIPRELLPASVFEFAADIGLGWYLDKRYRESVAA